MRLEIKNWLVYLTVACLGLAACGDDSGTSGSSVSEAGAIEGTITLEANGSAPGVLVDIVDSRAEAETADDGSFFFESLAAQALVLEISYPDYVTERIEVEVVAGETVEVEHELQQVNVAPSISEVVLEPPVFEPGGTATVTVTATDPNPDTLSYAFEATDGYTISDTQDNQATITAPEGFDVEGLLTVTVSDEDGETASDEVDLITVDNAPPVLEGVVALPSVVQPGQTAEVSVSASDADDDELTYEWEVPAEWSISDASAPTAQVTAPDEYGQTAVVKVTVRDAYDVAARGQVVLKTAENLGPQITSVTAAPPQTTPGGEITLTASASDPEGGELTYQWTAPSEWVLADDSATTTTLSAPDQYGVSETINLTVSDETGASAQTSIIVSTTSNNAPVISSVTASPNSVARGGSVQLGVGASDPNGDVLSYQWTAPSGWSLSDATVQSPTLTAAAQSAQTASVQVTVTDTDGLTASGSVVISTTANQAPVLSSLVAVPQQVAPDGTITVDALATDADGDTLTYNWTVPSDWTLNGSGASVTLTAPSTYSSSAVVELTVEDDFGGSATGQLTVSTVNNITPTITSLTADANPLNRAQTTMLRAAATDANGDDLTYTWLVSDTAWTVTPDPNDASMADLQAPDTPNAAATVTLTVEDSAGASTSSNLRISTRSNNAPVVTSLTANNNPLARGTSTELSAAVSDPDGNPLTYDWSVSDSAWTVTADLNDPKLATLQAPDTPGVATTVTLAVTDDAGATTTATLRVATEANAAPVISSVTAQDNPLARNASTTLFSSTYDPNGDALTYQWQVNDANWTVTVDPNDNSRATLQAPDTPGASATVTLTVTDEVGASTTADLQASTISNATPVISSFTAQDNPVARAASTTLNVTASDPNGDPLTYTWSVANSSWTVDGSTPADPTQATLIAPNTPGASTSVTVTVSDDTGKSAQAELRVSVPDNDQPIISSLYADQDPVARTATTAVTVNASDPNGDPLTYSWSLNNSAWSYTGSGTAITLQAPDVPDSTVKVTATVQDDAGGQTIADIVVSTKLNDTPQIVSTPPTQAPVASGRELWSYQVVVEDLDDSSLTYSLQGAGATSATFDTSTGLLEWTPFRSEAGDYTFIIEVSDGWETASQQFNVTVEPFDLTESSPLGGLYRYGYPRVADVDGDGMADVINTNGNDSQSTALAVLRSSNGYASDQVEPNSVDVGYCRGIAVGDINGDSAPDVVAACRYKPSTGTRPSIVTWINGIDQSTQTGSFSLGAVYDASTTAGPYIEQIELADINGDGHLDAVASDRGRRYVHTWLGNGSGGFSAKQSMRPQRITSYYRDYHDILDHKLADMDSDGTLELVLSERDYDGSQYLNRVRTFNIAGDGTISSSPSSSLDTGTDSNYYSEILLVDFNDDSYPDLFSSSNSNNQTTQYYENDGAGNLSSAGQTIGSCGSYSGYQGMDAGDIDQDGQIDVVMANRCNDTVTVVFGDGTGAFDETVTIAANNTYNTTYTAALGDYDGDGTLDIYTGNNYYYNNLTVLY